MTHRRFWLICTAALLVPTPARSATPGAGLGREDLGPRRPQCVHRPDPLAGQVVLHVPRGRRPRRRRRQAAGPRIGRRQGLGAGRPDRRGGDRPARPQAVDHARRPADDRRRRVGLPGDEDPEGAPAARRVLDGRPRVDRPATGALGGRLAVARHLARRQGLRHLVRRLGPGHPGGEGGGQDREGRARPGRLEAEARRQRRRPEVRPRHAPRRARDTPTSRRCASSRTAR